MKFLLVLILSVVFSLTSFGQVNIYLRSGKISNNAIEKNPSNDVNYFTDNIYNNRYYLWLQFNEIPNATALESLKATGVELFDYLPDNTYIASFPKNYNFNQLVAYNVYGVCKPLAAYKIDGSMYNPSKIEWAVNGDKLKATISFTQAVTKENFIASLQNFTTQFQLLNNVNNQTISVEASLADIQKIAAHPLVEYIEPITHPAVIEDIQGVSDHRASTVQTSDNWTNGKKYDGTGVVIAVGDGGMQGTHIDFQGRILSNSSTTATQSVWHSDHVSGIIGGAGNLNPQVRGQAPGANLRVYDYYEPYGILSSIYNTDSVRIVSHSLGQVCNSGYDADARSSDLYMKNYPSLMYVHSAGNSGSTSCGGLFDFKTITGGFKAGKNIITVGNLSKSDVINSSSSKGPLPDGRIKPEVSAVGTNVNSTQPNNTYTLMTGTSMSTPAVTGNLALMYQAYKVKNNAEPEGNLMKAIIMNSADDLGNEGPDFSYGYGRINTRKAVKTIENANYFTGTIATTGSVNTHNITIPANVATAKIMVYWADPAAAAGAAKSLVNNLDAKITDATATAYLPWVLDIGATPDESTCSAPAVKGIDSVNNMEQIQLDNPTAGNYTLTVTGKKVPTPNQKYYVTYDYSYTDEVTVTYPNGGESFAPSEVQRLRWDASTGTDPFTLQYSINGGTSWTNISTAIAPDLRYYDWTVPAAATSKQALIKITRNTTSDVSDTSFIILKVPTNVTFTDVCAGRTTVSWTAVTGATSYDVFVLGDKYTDRAGETSTTSFTVDGVGADQRWYAVRAKLASKNANGRRTIAVAHTNSLTTTCLVPVKLISFDATQKGSEALLSFIVSTESGILNYVIEKSATPNFENAEIVTSIKPLNSNTTTNYSYSVLDKKLNLNGITYYRLKIVEYAKATYSNVKVINAKDKLNSSFTFSPNPAKEFVNISINAGANITTAKLKLFNALGTEVINQTINRQTTTINTSNLPSGNYFVVINNAINNEVLFKQAITIVK